MEQKERNDAARHAELLSVRKEALEQRRNEQFNKRIMEYLKILQMSNPHTPINELQRMALELARDIT